MAFDPNALAQFVVAAIPLVIKAGDVIFYVLTVGVYGGIAARGMRVRINPMLRYLVVIPTGVLCLAASTAFSPYLPFPREGIFQFADLNSLFSGLLVAIALSLSFTLLTHNLKGDAIKILRAEVASLRAVLLRENVVSPVSESHAKQAASKAANGEAVSAKLEGDFWRVVVSVGKKQAEVLVDALDGAVKEVIYSRSRIANYFHDSTRLIGLIMLIAIAAIVSASFSGFPSVSKQLEAMGLGPDMLSQLSPGQQSLSQNCIQAERLVNGIIIANYPVYQDSGLKDYLEKQSGAKITELRSVATTPVNTILGVTNDSRACLLANSEFCSCLPIKP